VNEPFKLFFDECCAKRLARKIVEIYKECYPNLETKHLTDYFETGDDEGEFLPLLAEEKNWIVVTADRGKDPKKVKMPIVCARLGITHISLTSDLVNAGYKAQKQALLCVWPEIMLLHRIPAGTRVSLGYRMVNKGSSKIPCLWVANKPFSIWCQQNDIQTSN
jgi:hypothetical protein